MNAVLAIALAVAAAATPAGEAGLPFDVATSIDPPVIPFHRQARFNIAVEGPEGMAVEFPEMANKFGGLAIYGAPLHSEVRLGSGRVRIAETYVLDPTFVGDYAIAPVKVRVKTPGGPDEAVSVVVPSPTVRVRELTPEETEEAERFEPNAGPIDPPRSLVGDWRLVAAATGTTGLTAAWLFLFLRRRRAVEHTPPLVPPWEAAYRALRELDRRNWPATGRFEPYYVELSAILRHYIEDRFNVHAPERTTPEFLAEAAGARVFSDEQQKLLATFLRHCDRVKFARYKPSLDQMEQSFADVLRFIDETAPAPPTESAENEAVGGAA
ncbi:MAG: hypothetical protein JXR94_24265 [Candidatus Hydrogenedentes bacterium]|nr:hypothetical protein [Candidatus Hydrogenedentota bacterium]